MAESARVYGSEITVNKEGIDNLCINMHFRALTRGYPHTSGSGLRLGGLISAEFCLSRLWARLFDFIISCSFLARISAVDS